MEIGLKIMLLTAQNDIVSKYKFKVKTESILLCCNFVHTHNFKHLWKVNVKSFHLVYDNDILLLFCDKKFNKS